MSEQSRFTPQWDGGPPGAGEIHLLAFEQGRLARLGFKKLPRHRTYVCSRCSVTIRAVAGDYVVTIHGDHFSLIFVWSLTLRTWAADDKPDGDDVDDAG